MKYPIIEHHYEVEAGIWTEAHVGTTTNTRRTIEELANQRREGDLPTTLSHWTVGDKSVVAQSALTLANRQAPPTKENLEATRREIDRWAFD